MQIKSFLQYEDHGSKFKGNIDFLVRRINSSKFTKNILGIKKLKWKIKRNWNKEKKFNNHFDAASSMTLKTTMLLQLM